MEQVIYYIFRWQMEYYYLSDIFNILSDGKLNRVSNLLHQYQYFYVTTLSTESPARERDGYRSSHLYCSVARRSVRRGTVSRSLGWKAAALGDRMAVYYSYSSAETVPLSTDTAT